jgi:hypothetical protein
VASTVNGPENEELANAGDPLSKVVKVLLRLNDAVFPFDVMLHEPAIPSNDVIGAA